MAKTKSLIALMGFSFIYGGVLFITLIVDVVKSVLTMFGVFKQYEEEI